MNVVRMMKEDEQKKILLNYIYLSRQHAGGKDQVAINLLERRATAAMHCDLPYGWRQQLRR